MTTLVAGNRYNLSFYSPDLFGASLKNVLVEAEMLYSAALESGQDIRAQHARIYSTLPATTPNDPSKYKYVQLRVNGKRLIVGLPWIIPNSVVELINNPPTITIGDATPADETTIRNILNANGFNQIDITYSNG